MKRTQRYEDSEFQDARLSDCNGHNGQNYSEVDAPIGFYYKNEMEK